MSSLELKIVCSLHGAIGFSKQLASAIPMYTIHIILI